MQRDAAMIELLTKLRAACEAQDERQARVLFEALDDAYGEDPKLRGMFLDAYTVDDPRHPHPARMAGMRRVRDRCAQIIDGSSV